MLCNGISKNIQVKSDNIKVFFFNFDNQSEQKTKSKEDTNTWPDVIKSKRNSYLSIESETRQQRRRNNCDVF